MYLFYKKILLTALAFGLSTNAIVAATAEKKWAASTTTKEAQTNKTWDKYNYKESHFSVDLPAKPDHVRQKIDVPKSDLTIEYDTYVSEPSDDIVYVISVWDYPSEIDMSHPETNLKDGFSGMLSALPGSKVINTEMTDVQGFKALEFLVKNEDVYFQGRLIIAYNTLYQVFTVYRDSIDTSKDYKKFISSFKILDPDSLKHEQHKDSGKNSRLNV